MQPIVAHCCEVMYFGSFDFRGELGFLNCDDICMCVVNKQFELLEFVFESVYVDLQYDEISLTFTAWSVCLCGVCSPVVGLGLSVRLSWTLCCGCGCCGDCDSCTVVCVVCVFAVIAYMDGTRGSGVLASASDVLEMSVVIGVGGVCVWHGAGGVVGDRIGFGIYQF